jgi:hypothetical protein
MSFVRSLFIRLVIMGNTCSIRSADSCKEHTTTTSDVLLSLMMAALLIFVNELGFWTSLQLLSWRRILLRCETSKHVFRVRLRTTHTLSVLVSHSLL